MPPVRSLTSHELRQIVESADGKRGVQLYLVWRPGLLDPQLVEKTDIQPGDDVALMLETDDAHVWPPSKVQITPGGGSPYPLDGYDAVFWSQSAFEKFVIPYYAGFKSQDYLDQLWTAVRLGQDVFAMAHLPKSEPGVLSADPVVTLWKPIEHGKEGAFQVTPLSTYITMALTEIGLAAKALPTEGLATETPSARDER